MKLEWAGRRAALLTVLVTAATAGVSDAGGYLWFGSELAGEGTIYRYDIDEGIVDTAVSPTLPPGGSHWNNMATDGVRLYLGTPTTQYLGYADPHTGLVDSSTSYSPSLAGHKEDGAFRSESGTLWRITYSDLLHETTPDGVLVRTYAFPAATPGLVGLEWVRDTLYATDYSAGNPAHIGIVDLDSTDNSATFTVIPWKAGGAPPGGSPGDWTAGLAYDPEAGTLYMATYSSTRLFSVVVEGDSAGVLLVATLDDVGYVSGGLIDGMGWVSGSIVGIGDARPQPSIRIFAAPNPAAGEALCRFLLPSRADVLVGVWDVSGRLVREVHRGPLPGGAHTAIWDGRDQRGGSVSSGVYFIRVTARGESAETKIVFVR